MSDNASENQVSHQLDQLQQRLQELISLCTKLRVENKSLLDQQASLVEERARLIEKNEMARSKVESMITRLKSMEASQ
ncbi:MAG: TIGR02449 family protein [Granulosicoccus sp.]|nr:TIGR02449 family protein [Granulosicoccus sp.]